MDPIALALGVARRSVLGVDVRYCRRDLCAVIRAGRGATRRVVHQESGLAARLETRDYLIYCDELLLEGLPVLPEVGDRIGEPAEAPTRWYEVRPLESEPAWRFADPGQTHLRVHTILIDDTPPT